MASYALRFILHNVRVVGGCCGTTPEHIRQIKSAVRALAPAAAKASPVGAPGHPEHAPHAPVNARLEAPPVPREEKSQLARQLAKGAFTIAVELRAPRGFQTQSSVERA